MHILDSQCDVVTLTLECVLLIGRGSFLGACLLSTGAIYDCRVSVLFRLHDCALACLSRKRLFMFKICQWPNVLHVLCEVMDAW